MRKCLSLPIASFLVSYLLARGEPTQVLTGLSGKASRLAYKYKTWVKVNGRDKHLFILVQN